MYLVETAGVEPASKDNGTCASTGVAVLFNVSLIHLPNGRPLDQPV